MKTKNFYVICLIVSAMCWHGCAMKVVGDPDRPITMHIKLDINGLEKTATNIEDYVRGDTELKPQTKEKP